MTLRITIGDGGAWWITSTKGINGSPPVTLKVDPASGKTIGGPLSDTLFTFKPELPAYAIVNLRAGLTRANWEVTVFLNNVTDERALLALDRERGTRARVGFLTNQPRTAGITLRFNY